MKKNKNRFSHEASLNRRDLSCILTNSCRVASSMKRIFQERVVPVELDSLRADKAAAILFPDFSRNELSKWIKVGDLSVNGETKRAKDKLFAGDTLILSAEVLKVDAWHEPERLDLDVIYEDDDLLVLNKRSGLVMHPGAGNSDGTLLNGLLAYRPSLNVLPRAGIVHRLDKDTSGLLVVACSKLAYKELIDMIAKKSLKRRYHAVCEGKLVSGFDVNRPIGRDRKNRTKQVISSSGRESLTEIRVIQRYDTHSLVQAELKTGRTHQIRVHMSSLGHPLVGDSKYGAKRLLPKGIGEEKMRVVRQFERQALHSASLRFRHPRTGDIHQFSARWPKDFLKLVEALGGKEEIWE